LTLEEAQGSQVRFGGFSSLSLLLPLSPSRVRQPTCRRLFSSVNQQRNKMIRNFRFGKYEV
jgi:hypothetical protein